MESNRRLILAITSVVGIGSLLLGQTASNSKPPVAQPSFSNANSTASDTTSRPGRYQIFFNPNARADTFLVDTQTGKVWQFVDIHGYRR
jgi:hypothetical protein